MENKSSQGPGVIGPRMANRLERRRRVRTQVHWRVCFYGATVNGAVEATTQDLSSIGFHCLAPVPLVPGDKVTCLLRVPSHERPGDVQTLVLECSVRIVRVDPPVDGSGSYGIAGEIEDYSFCHRSQPQFGPLGTAKETGEGNTNGNSGSGEMRSHAVG